MILRTLAKNPANRYQTAEELRRDLERVRRGAPVEATPLLPADVGTTQVIPHDRGPRTAVLPPTREPEPERSRWWIPVLVTLLILGVLALVLFLLARNLLQDEPQANLVTVPDVVGERFNAARSTLEGEGFEVVTPPIAIAAEDAPDEFADAEPGTVVAQDPAANDEVPEGSQVTLTVIAQPDLVPVPEVPQGSTVEEATAILIDAGLVPAATPVEQASDTVDEGLVIGTDPPAGEEVPPESEVAIIVSTGPDLVTVPDVRCRSVNSAQNELERANLQGVISSTTVAENPNCPLGNKVADQNPAPLSEVAPGTVVELFFSEGTTPTGPTGGTGPTGATGETGDDRS